MSMLKVLPSMECTFTISVKGTETTRQFDGSFTYRRPNIKTRSDIEKTIAMLHGGVKTLDEDTKFIHEMLAALKHTLINCPEWWKEADYGFELYDLNVISEVYKACLEFENRWKKEVYLDQKEEVKDAK